MSKHNRILAFVVTMIALSSVQADAGLFRNVRYALGYAGFQQQLTRDYIGDGWTFDFGTNWVNKEFNFGNEQLTLSGPIGGSVSITQRGIPQIKFNLNTPNGIAYNFFATDGPQRFTVDNGAFSIQQQIIVNQYGGYDVQLRVRNRGTLVSEGPNGTVSAPLDYDIGPIDIHGHWLVDLVNLTLGRAFDFTLPGGSIDQVVAAMNQAINGTLSDAVDQLQSQITAAKVDLATLPPAPAGAIIVVPEPASLGLLILGAGLIRRRR